MLGGKRGRVLEGRMAAGDGLEGKAGLEGHGELGERFDAGQIFGIEGDTEIGERLKCGRIVGVLSGTHAGGERPVRVR
jgi:hypothetical protein